jgi:hypothetical protein
MHLYLLGDISYGDRLDAKASHRTQFAYEIMDINIIDQQFLPGTQIVVAPLNVRASMTTRGDHNCADEECPDN